MGIVNSCPPSRPTVVGREDQDLAGLGAGAILSGPAGTSRSPAMYERATRMTSSGPRNGPGSGAPGCGCHSTSSCITGRRPSWPSRARARRTRSTSGDGSRADPSVMTCSISMLTSRAGAEWVSAPTEMKSTPVAAISADGLERDAARGLERRALRPSAAASSRAATAARRSPGSMLSSRIRRAPAASASRTSSEVAALDLGDEVGAALGGEPDRVADPARERRVVLLDQDRVVEADAMVAPAARGDRGLLEGAQARRRLPRVEDPGAGAGDRLRVARGQRRHARTAGRAG